MHTSFLLLFYSVAMLQAIFQMKQLDRIILSTLFLETIFLGAFHLTCIARDDNFHLETQFIFIVPLSFSIFVQVLKPLLCIIVTEDKLAENVIPAYSSGSSLSVVTNLKTLL
ncbi:hypothetical protein GDO81_011838 [Engystomops pustulosus]|uniref:Uncharacterized protein n=1 Tax=Engystomops pustulosus TaxID=76066 RepID=A0AAV7BH60_ENGPU|nr:hypothetical protein GDO81_011838 [Engystomops pustulosus]